MTVKVVFKMANVKIRLLTVSFLDNFKYNK